MCLALGSTQARVADASLHLYGTTQQKNVNVNRIPMSIETTMANFHVNACFSMSEMIIINVSLTAK